VDGRKLKVWFHLSTLNSSLPLSDSTPMPPKQVAGMSQKRIARELADLKKDTPPGVVCQPRDDSIFEWDATIGKHYSILYHHPRVTVQRANIRSM
jgi:hypothetical protein